MCFGFFCLFFFPSSSSFCVCCFVLFLIYSFHFCIKRVAHSVQGRVAYKKSGNTMVKTLVDPGREKMFSTFLDHLKGNYDVLEVASLPHVLSYI